MSQKQFPSLFALLLLANAVLGASRASSPITDELSRIDHEMMEISQLEQQVVAQHATYADMAALHHPLLDKVSSNDDLAASLFGSTAPGHERLLDIPGFLWGFCCSVVGMLLVYVAIEDPEARKKEGAQAILGCAFGTLLWAGAYVLLVAYATTF